MFYNPNAWTCFKPIYLYGLESSKRFKPSISKSILLYWKFNSGNRQITSVHRVAFPQPHCIFSPILSVRRFHLPCCSLQVLTTSTASSFCYKWHPGSFPLIVKCNHLYKFVCILRIPFHLRVVPTRPFSIIGWALVSNHTQTSFQPVWTFNTALFRVNHHLSNI